MQPSTSGGRLPLLVSLMVLAPLSLIDDAKVQKKSQLKELFSVYSLIFLEMLKCKEIIHKITYSI